MLKNSFAKIVAGVATLALATSVMAQSATPTTAAGLAQSVDLSDAKSAGLIVVGMLVTLGIVLWGGRLVLSHFRPK